MIYVTVLKELETTHLQVPREIKIKVGVIDKGRVLLEISGASSAPRPWMRELSHSLCPIRPVRK